MRIPLTRALLFLTFGVINDVTATHPDDTEDVVKKRASPTTTTAAPAQIAHLEAVTAKLSADLTALNANYRALRTDSRHAQSELSQTTHTLHHLSQVANNLTRDVRNHYNAASYLNSYVTSKVQQLQTHMHNVEYGVGFTAQFKNNTLGPDNLIPHNNHHQYLKFDRVWQRGGINYNTTSGRFKAPSDGMYAFFLAIQRNDPDRDVCLQVDVSKPNNSLLTTVSACGPGYTSASNMAVTYLRAGQSVKVGTRNPELLQGYIHTSFTGFKF